MVIGISDSRVARLPSLGIKQLWAKVAALLGDEPSALEREALAIEPAGEG